MARRHGPASSGLVVSVRTVLIALIVITLAAIALMSGSRRRGSVTQQRFALRADGTDATKGLLDLSDKLRHVDSRIASLHNQHEQQHSSHSAAADSTHAPSKRESKRSLRGKPALNISARGADVADDHANLVVKRRSTHVTASPPPRRRPSPPGPKLKLALLTTLKPCDVDAVFDAQLAAVASWIALPLDPPPTVYLVDTEAGDDTHKTRQTCSQLIAKMLPRVKAIRSASIESTHGTVLLGPALALLADLESTADVVGLINGDILLHPHTARALQTAKATFSRFFIVGRRAGVDLRSDSVREEVMPKVVKARKGWTASPPPLDAEQTTDDMGPPSTHDDATTDSDPFGAAEWFSHEVFKRAIGDRIDAEDYFLYTRGFFDALSYPIPSFHIGRPAFDNWLVHTAIHTLQPVIDGTGAIPAYHQMHNYAHLKPHAANDGAPHTDAVDTKSWSYWGGKDQQENYDLALARGGWRHGLFDFALLHFVGSEPAENPAAEEEDGPNARQQAATKLQISAAVNSGDCLTGAPKAYESCLAVTLKPGWKPLGNDDFKTDRDIVTLASLEDYYRMLGKYVLKARHRRWNELAHAAGNPYLA
jgi:hypothetical protein